MSPISKNAALRAAITLTPSVLLPTGESARSGWQVVMLVSAEGKPATTLVKDGHAFEHADYIEVARRSLSEAEAAQLIQAHQIAGTVGALRAAYEASQRPKTPEEVQAQFSAPPELIEPADVNSFTLTGTLESHPIPPALLTQAGRQVRSTTRQQERHQQRLRRKYR